MFSFGNPIIKILPLLLCFFFCAESFNGGDNGETPGNGDQTDPDKTNLNDATIGPEGGTVEDPNGNWKLTVPPGAVQSEVTFSVTESFIEHSEAFTALTPIYHFEPSGITFNEPVLFTQTYSQLDMPEQGLAEQIAHFYYIDGDNYELAQSTIDADLNEVTTALPHFSFGFFATLAIHLVNAEIITHPSIIALIADFVTDHFIDLGSDQERRDEYIEHQDILNPFFAIVEDSTGTNTLYAQFPFLNFLDMDPPASAGLPEIEKNIFVEPSVELSWSNPPDSDFAGVLLVRSSSEVDWQPDPKTIYTPGSFSGYDILYSGNASAYSDLEPQKGSTYYYKVFTFDSAINYSEAIELQIDFDWNVQYVFLLDSSGSMQPEGWQAALDLAGAITDLIPSDGTFNVGHLKFSTDIEIINSLSQLTPANKAAVMANLADSAHLNNLSYLRRGLNDAVDEFVDNWPADTHNTVHILHFITDDDGTSSQFNPCFVYNAPDPPPLNHSTYRAYDDMAEETRQSLLDTYIEVRVSYLGEDMLFDCIVEDALHEQNIVGISDLAPTDYTDWYYRSEYFKYNRWD